MGNKQTREFLRQQDVQASWDRLRTQAWRPADPDRALGSGFPRVQLIRLPLFEQAAFWEVCERDSSWVLYTASVIDPDWHALTVRGYDPVDFPPEKLKSYFDRLVSVAMPIAPELRKLAGLDGAITQLTLYGWLHSQATFQWWSDAPPAWLPMVKIADEMLEVFGKARI